MDKQRVSHRGNTVYTPGNLYRSRQPGHPGYRADAEGNLVRADGRKLSKAERKAERRAAAKEMKLNRGRAVGSSPDP